MKKSWSKDNKNRVSGQVCRREQYRLRKLVEKDKRASWWKRERTLEEIERMNL